MQIEKCKMFNAEPAVSFCIEHFAFCILLRYLRAVCVSVVKKNGLNLEICGRGERL